MESLFNKVTGLKTGIFVKRDSNAGVFSMNIARFLKTAFLWNTCTFYFPEILCDDEYEMFEGYILLL